MTAFGPIALRMSSVILLRATGAGLGLLSNVAIARSLGPSGAGGYFLAFTLVTVASVVSRLGLDQIFLRHAAADLGHGKVAQFAAIFRSGILLSILVGATSTLVLYFLRGPIGQLFSDSAVASCLAFMAWAIVPLSVGTLFAELLKGLGASNSALVLQAIIVPLALLAVLSAGGVDTSSDLAWFFALANLLVGLVGYSIWRWRVSGTNFGQFKLALSTTWKLSSPLFVVALTNLVLAWTDTLMLGYWSTSRDVGIYGMSMRLATLPSFFLVATASVVAPRLASLHAVGNVAEMERLARSSATAMTLLSLPIVLALILFPGWVLKIAGPDFSEGALALAILAIGQFVIVATGPAGFVLSMSGRQAKLRNVSVMGALLNVTLNATLIPSLGLLGAAMGTAISLSVMNLALARASWRQVGVNALPYLRVLGAWKGEKLA